MTLAPVPPEHLYYHALSATENWSYLKLKRLYEEHGSWESVYAVVARSHSSRSPAKLWSEIASAGCRLVLYGDADYPPLLREIPYPPHGIYVRGLLPPPEQYCIAMVGTRRATEHGLRLTTLIATELAHTGIGIVSGLAFGVDSAAHRGALAGGGPTIAVLASGCLRITPRSNQGLADQILAAGGAIISEYAPLAEALPHQFIERNRIVSGLAKATLVLEAPARSGTLATARFAIEQNREVFVVPGVAGSAHHAGSHGLIRAGARLVENTEQILEDLGLAPAAPRRPATLAFLDEPAGRIVELLTTQGVLLTADAIAAETTLDITAVNQSLGLLSLHGLIREEGGRYALT